MLAVEFNGCGKSRFSLENKAIIGKSIRALKTVTGLPIEQTRSTQDEVEFDIKTPSGLILLSFRYINDADGLTLVCNESEFEARVIGANRALFQLREG